MNRSKKIFIIVAALFLIAILVVSYDISTRTTFPGSKPQLKERIDKDYSTKDTTAAGDTIN